VSPKDEKGTEMMKRWLLGGIVVLVSFAVAGHVIAQEQQAAAKKPSVLILTGGFHNPVWPGVGDFTILNELYKEGIQVDVHSLGERPARPVNWELIKNYNCLVLFNLPAPKDQPRRHGIWTGPPQKKEFEQLLERYMASGGGVFLLLFSRNTPAQYNTFNDYLRGWGARLPLEELHDAVAETRHVRLMQPFIYADPVPDSPVAKGVRGVWFPASSPSGHWHCHGQPIAVSEEWQEVLKGGPTTYSVAKKTTVAMSEKHTQAFIRPGKTKSPTLFAVREIGGGRMALTVMWGIYHLLGGKSWIHDGVVWDKGMAGKPSDFGLLFKNTVRWLSEPSLKSGKLGGYVQDPLQLVHPHYRRKPNEFFDEFESYQNPTPPGNVYRGLIGARTSYSVGQGTVPEYAAAARRAGLDFVIFMEQFGKIAEADYRKLEKECAEHSDDRVLLIPGLGIKNNIGNHMFVYGRDVPWPKPSQLDGPQKDQLRTQCFDEDGKLTYNDEDAKNWLWASHGVNPGHRNIGYYDFSGEPGVPVRNLRLFGILGVMTYRDGKLVEDITEDYIDYVTDGDPPLACAVDIVNSPGELEEAVRQGHYLTHVAAHSLAGVPAAMHYGHQYGRANVYPSSGPQIRSWAGTQRFMTYAGESFVAARRRARPECWVTSDVGLKEIVVYSETRPVRRFLLHGAKEFHQTFEWAYDRHREMVLIATDVRGGRAVSAGRSLWSDTNHNSWCSDRQNGEMWHGPLTLPSPQRPEFTTGPTWDGGPPPPACPIFDVHPAVRARDGTVEGFWRGRGGRLMEGNVYPTCFDDSVRNFACVAEHEYAPGVVANAYHTLGPIHPSKYMTFTLRRTQFLQRGQGPQIDGHAMYPERKGGNLAVIEGTITLKEDVGAVHFGTIWPHSFPKSGENFPLFAFQSAAGRVGFGRIDTFAGPGLAAGLGPQKPRGGYLVETGGYVALMPSLLGITGIAFNIGDEPLLAVPIPVMKAWWFDSARQGGFRKGEVISWRYMVINDPIDEPARNLMRIEALRKYYGLAGQGGSGIEVRRGKLLSHRGLVDLAPEKGVVEFEVPNPGWRLNLPLGIRFIGFNPNWTVGQLQIEGYSPGFYTNGQNVYRNLGLDDRDMAFLAVYPDHARNTHNIVGHPVQCDNPDLIIQVSELNIKPFQYHVAVNNPTDEAIRTTLTKCINLPGFEFPDRPVEVPPGGYLIVKEK